MAHLTKAQQRKFQPVLLRILKHLGVKLERMEEAILQASTQTTSREDDDLAAEGYSQDSQLSLIENQDEMLRSVRAALDRIQHGTFGDCQGCGQLIPARRLEVVPYTRFCVDCKQQAEHD